MIYHDADGSCELSIAELARVCSGAMFQTCLDFLESAKSRLRSANPFTRPDIGFANVMAYNDADDLRAKMAELASICQQFFNECIAFLESSEPSTTV